MIGIATVRAQQLAVPNLEFGVAAMNEPGPPGRLYDVVLAFNLFHLVPDTGKALSNVAGLLRPGGRLLCKTPCMGELWGGLRWVIPLLRVAGKAPFVNFFTGPELLEHIERAGLEVLETGHYPRKTRSFFIAARKP
jgi:SAM-dependent methyltransferase